MKVTKIAINPVFVRIITAEWGRNPKEGTDKQFSVRFQQRGRPRDSMSSQTPHAKTPALHFKCPLCGTPSSAQMQSHGRDFHHCRECDLIAIAAEQHLPAGAQRERYAFHENSLENGGYVRMFEAFIERVRVHAPPRAKALDVGCGPRRVLIELMRRAGYDAGGFDPVYGIDDTSGTPFDLIVSTEAFEHISRPGESLAFLVGLLDHEGVLAVMTRLHPGFDAIGDWWYARDPTHVSFYSGTTMQWIAGKYGLSLLECDDVQITVMRKCRQGGRPD